MIVALFAVACVKEVENDFIENKPPVVNAGSDSTYRLDISENDTIRLSGSASDSDGSVVGFTWTQISGPNTAKIHYPGSVSTAVSGVISGQYTFQLMATDQKGATGIKSVKITVVAPPVLSASYQPRNSNLEMHLGVVGNSNFSDAASPELVAMAWTNNGTPTYFRALLKFDWSNIPATARIKSAKLTLYSNPTPINGNGFDANYGENNAILIQRVTSNWTVPVSWQTQPAGVATNQVVVPHTSQSRLDLVDVDVTNLVKDMRQSGNNGFLIKLQQEEIYTSRVFCSSKYSDAAKHPKLVVAYTN